MTLFYGFLVAFVGIMVFRAKNLALAIVFGIVFLGWLIYANFHPYGSQYASAFNIILDVSLLMSCVFIKYFCVTDPEKRSLYWTGSVFVIMIINHLIAILTSTPLAVYYLISNALFLLQLAIIGTFSLQYLNKPKVQEPQECPTRANNLLNLRLGSVQLNKDRAV